MGRENSVTRQHAGQSQEWRRLEGCCGFQAAVVDRRQIITAAMAAHAVAPSAMYRLVRSGASSSVLGKPRLGFVAVSARATKSSLMLFQVTLTWSGWFMLREAAYWSGWSSLRWVVLSLSALSAVYTEIGRAHV